VVRDLDPYAKRRVQAIGERELVMACYGLGR
jgi:hypothetical protein